VIRLHLNILNAVICVGMLHTHCLMNILVNSFTLKAQIELNSISMSKNDPKITELDKYDVEANIDEVESEPETDIKQDSEKQEQETPDVVRTGTIALLFVLLVFTFIPLSLQKLEISSLVLVTYLVAAHNFRIHMELQ